MFNENMYSQYEKHNNSAEKRKWQFTYPLRSLRELVDGNYNADDLCDMILNCEGNPAEYTINRYRDVFSRYVDSASQLDRGINLIRDNMLVYVGTGEDRKDWYFSCIQSEAHGPEFFIFDTAYKPTEEFPQYTILPFAQGIGNIANQIPGVDAMDSYYGIIHTVSDLEIALEDDFEFGGDVNTTDAGNDTSNNPPPDNNAGGDMNNNDGGTEDLTQTTQNAMDNDPTLNGDMNSDANMMGDSPDNDGMDSQPPDGNDGDNPDNDSDDDTDDEGTEAKKRIRKNLVKLHAVIKDSLETMGTFAPSYNAESARKYYKIQSNLSSADDIIIKICNETINDLTVDSLMKKYVTLCNIFDIETRALKAFAEEYKKESKMKGQQIKKDANRK